MNFLRSRWLVLAILLTLGGLQAVLYQRLPTIEPDSSYYLGLAQSLIGHQGYVFNTQPHAIYPPGLPLLLAGSMAIFGDSYRAQIFLMPLFGGVGLWAAYLLLRRGEDWRVAAAIVLGLGCSPYLFSRTTQLIASDPPYFAFSFLTLLIVYQLSAGRPSLPRHSWWLAAAAALTMSSALLLRSVGVALLAAVALQTAVLFLQGHRAVVKRLLPALLLGVSVTVAWSMWTSVQTRGRDPKLDFLASYGYQIRLKDFHQPDAGFATAPDLLTRMVKNVPQAGAALTSIVLSGTWIDQTWFAPLALLPVLFIGLGFVASLRKGPTLLEFYCFFYLSVYALWWLELDGARFLFPVAPLLLLYVVRGGKAALAFSLRARYITAAVCAGMALISLLGIRQEIQLSAQLKIAPLLWVVVLIPLFMARIIDNRRFSWAVAAVAIVLLLRDAQGIGQLGRANLAPDFTRSPHYPALKASEWIRTHTGSGDVVMADEEPTLSYLTHRKIIAFPVTSDGDSIIRRLQQRNVRFVVAEKSRGASYFRPSAIDRAEIVQRKLGSRSVVIENTNLFQVLEVLK